MRIHQEKYIQVYIDYLIEYVRVLDLLDMRVTEYEMIIYETIHIPTRGE